MVTISKRFIPKEMRRFIRFAIVGASGTLIDVTLLTLLKAAGLPTLPANTLSFTAGVINNFTLNRRWTYPEARSQAAWPQFGQFLLVSLIGVLLNNAIVLLLEAPFGLLIEQPTFGYLPAKAVATILVALWNFFANRYWTFRAVGA